MQFSFDVHLNDDDYYALNEFAAFKSTSGKKRLLCSRLLWAALFGIAILYVFLRNDAMTVKIITASVGFIGLVIFELLLPKFMRSSLKRNIAALKKDGKLAYSPEAHMEFYDDHFVKTTEGSKSEEAYSGVEKVSVWKDRYIYLHTDSVRAFVIPWASFTSDEERSRFIDFISGKCPLVNQYEQ